MLYLQEYLILLSLDIAHGFSDTFLRTAFFSNLFALEVWFEKIGLSLYQKKSV